MYATPRKAGRSPSHPRMRGVRLPEPRARQTGEQILRTLHTSGQHRRGRSTYDEGKHIVELPQRPYLLPRDFDSLSCEIDTPSPSHLERGGGVPVLCHNDFYGPNLLSYKGAQLIDREYAARVATTVATWQSLVLACLGQ